MGNNNGLKLWVSRRAVIAPALAAMTVAVLSACGGGGDGGSAATPAAVKVQGTAASGAFLANAKIDIFDATGKTVSAVADGNGRFEADIAALTAPLALVATGVSGGETVTYVSILATKPASGAATVNVTPLTTAIAALLVGGNPLDLKTAAILSSKGQSAQVAQAVTLLRLALANIVADAGLDANTFDPISTPLTTQHAGADSVIDTIRVTLTAAGATLTSTGAVLSDSTEAPKITLTSSSLGKPPSTVLPAPAIKTNATTFEAIRAGLQACFALAPSSRVSGAALAGACATTFAGDYKSNTYTAVDDLGFLFNAADMTGATFGAPVVLFNATNTLGEATALVRLPYVRADGSTDHLSRLITNRATGWTLTGNQRAYEAAVTRQVRKTTELNPVPADGIVSRYESALRVYFNPSVGSGTNVQLVRVTGPGLPAAGVTLSRSRACGSTNSLVVQNVNGSFVFAADDPLAPGQVIGSTAQSSNVVVISAEAANAGETVNWSKLVTGISTYPAAPVSNAAIEALPTYPRYKFEVWNRRVGGGVSATADDTFTVTGSGAILPATVLSRQSWNAINPTSYDFLTVGGTKTTTQGVTTVNWRQDAETADYVFIFGQLQTPAAYPLPYRIQIQSVRLATSARSATVGTALSTSSAGGDCSVSDYPAFTAAGDQRMIEVRSTQADDTQKFTRAIGTVR